MRVVAARLSLALCGVVALMSTVARVARAGPFLAENIAGDPDTLVPFNTFDPGAASPDSYISRVAGNFCRGMDFETPTSGYYICTSSLNASPTGLYRYVDGDSTLISALPSTFTAEGGLTLSVDNSALFASWGVAGDDRLYRISLPSGVFTLIGPIVLPGVAGSSLLGLAMSESGVLYGVDTTSDALYTIDPLTAQGTLVGALGVAVAGIGGLDFDRATGELILAADPTDTNIYMVDVATGIATLMGTLQFGTSSIASVSCGCPADLDNGTFTGTCDGGVDINDLLFFLSVFEAGLAAADVDDGTFTGTVDGGVDIRDLLFFLLRFENGC